MEFVCRCVAIPVDEEMQSMHKLSRDETKPIEVMEEKCDDGRPTRILFLDVPQLYLPDVPYDVPNTKWPHGGGGTKNNT